MRRVEVILHDGLRTKVTITSERITIKVNRALEPFMNIPWLIDIINTVVPLETQSLRGTFIPHATILALYTGRNHDNQWDEIRLNKFWKAVLP